MITINLGDDHVEHYSKSIAIDPDDVDPDSTDTTLELSAFAAFAAKKPQGGDDGQPL